MTHGKADTAQFSRAEGRQFGLTVGAAFLFIAAVLLWRSRETGAAATAVIGALLFAGGLIAPRSLRPIHRAWMAFAMALSKITTPIFMGIIYYLVLTPFGIVRRKFGNHPLVHRAEGGSYFKPRDPTARRDLRRQF